MDTYIEENVKTFLTFQCWYSGISSGISFQMLYNNIDQKTVLYNLKMKFEIHQDS